MQLKSHKMEKPSYELQINYEYLNYMIGLLVYVAQVANAL